MKIFYETCIPFETLLFKFLFIVYLFSLPPIAQLVEQSPLKRTVVGSSPTGRTNLNKVKIWTPICVPRSFSEVGLGGQEIKMSFQASNLESLLVFLNKYLCYK
jgi:hypothetical protein